MKNIFLFLVATALLILPIGSQSIAADGAELSGSVELGARITDNEDESAKFQEYRDLDDGMIGNFKLNYSKEAYFFGAEGENVGLDDQ